MFWFCTHYVFVHISYTLCIATWYTFPNSIYPWLLFLLFLHCFSSVQISIFSHTHITLNLGSSWSYFIWFEYPVPFSFLTKLIVDITIVSLSVQQSEVYHHRMDMSNSHQDWSLPTSIYIQSIIPTCIRNMILIVVYLLVSHPRNSSHPYHNWHMMVCIRNYLLSSLCVFCILWDVCDVYLVARTVYYMMEIIRLMTVSTRDV